MQDFSSTKSFLAVQRTKTHLLDCILHLTTYDMSHLSVSLADAVFELLEMSEKGKKEDW